MESTVDQELLKAIFTIKKRPGMFLCPLSIVSLGNYLEGYRFCCLQHGLIEERKLFLEFNHWLESYFAMPTNNITLWWNLILCICPSDGITAINFFYDRFEEFLAEKKYEIP